MSRHDDSVYFRHMLKHAGTAIELCRGKQRASLENEPMLRYSLLHLLTITGEAANRISAEGKSRYTEIAWRDIISTRNMLIHGYDIVDLDILWKTIETDLPALIESLEKIIGGSTRDSGRPSD